MMKLSSIFLTVVCALNFFDMQASSESGFARGFLNNSSSSSPLKKAPVARRIVIIDDACEYSVIDGDGQEEVVQAQEIDDVLLTVGYHLLYEDGVKSLKKQNSELYSRLLGVEIECNTLLKMRKKLREEAENYRYKAHELELALQATQKKYDCKSKELREIKDLCLRLEQKLEAKQAAILKHDEELDLHINMGKKQKFENTQLKNDNEMLGRRNRALSISLGGVLVITVVMGILLELHKRDSDEGNVGY